MPLESKPHGNRKDNPNPHILYTIYDHSRREIYKSYASPVVIPPDQGRSYPAR